MSRNFIAAAFALAALAACGGNPTGKGETVGTIGGAVRCAWSITHCGAPKQPCSAARHALNAIRRGAVSFNSEPCARPSAPAAPLALT